MSDLLSYFTDRTESMLDTLTEMVERESFTREKAQVDLLVDWMQERFQDDERRFGVPLSTGRMR